MSQPSKSSATQSLVHGSQPSSRPWVMTRRGRATLLVHRGMATAEYAVGILAAVALALVLLRVFTDNKFFAQMLKLVTQLIGKAGGMIG
ncbi:MAG TPA: DUF4244 domain-containing protein [Propionibacteriaceae bacterium]|nr:DUF4244 domain-containing protein [Propionibacteriaceae bacterium]